MNGAHEGPRLQDMLDGFIKKFVLCPECDNPETDLVGPMEMCPFIIYGSLFFYFSLACAGEQRSYNAGLQGMWSPCNGGPSPQTNNLHHQKPTKFCR